MDCRHELIFCGLMAVLQDVHTFRGRHVHLGGVGQMVWLLVG